MYYIFLSFISFFITTILSITSCYCAQSPLIVYAPKNAELQQIRKNLYSGKQKPSDFYPFIKIIKQIPEGKRYGVCYDYAVSKALNCVGKIPSLLLIEGGEKWITKYNILNDYFKETAYPKKGDIVSYRSTTIHHLGVVHDTNYVDSKWGIKDYICRHLTFYVPSAYGGEVRYHTLIMPIKDVIQDINKKIIMNLHQITYNFNTVNHWLLSTAEKYHEIDQEHIDNTLRKVSTIFDRNMLTRVDTTNTEKQTPFILAIKNRNLQLAKLFYRYGANINKQDGYGNTALHYAIHNNSIRTVKYLIKIGCSCCIKNNLKKTAYNYLKTRLISLSLKRKRRKQSCLKR